MKPATRTLTAFLALSFGSAYGAERLRIGVSNYNLSSLSMGVAHSRGFFKEEGFDSEVIRMNPNVATTAAVTGDIDFSALIGSLIGAAIKGAPLKLVACSQDRTPIVFVARDELMQKYPETTKRFLTAQILGMQLARNNKREAIKAGYDAGLRGDPDIVSRAYDLYSRGFTADLSVAEEGVQTMLEEDIRSGIVDKKMTVNRVIDERILKLAQQELRTEGKLLP
jgi:ABC-type nitrate/sulfonate/bicarbonate transport system substrate-binding protein